MKPLCIISGGTSGLGLALAKKLQDRYRLALIYHSNKARAGEAASFFDKEISMDAIKLFEGDLSLTKVAASVFQEISDWDSRAPSVLINAAGRTHPSFFLTDPVEKTIESIEANLYSCLNLSHLVLRKMFAARAGSVINISSISESEHFVFDPGYGMAKLAIESFTKRVAREVYRRGVRVNCVRPCLFETPMTETLLKGAPDNRRALISMKSVVGAIEYLLSDATQEISGTVLEVSIPAGKFKV